MENRCSHVFRTLFIICGAITVVQFINIFQTITSPRSIPLKTIEDGVILGESTNHILWFMQITDLHINKFYDQGRITDYQDFCNFTVNIIKPSVVIASGDLTDSKSFDNASSTQFKEEWEIYSSILHKNHIQSKTVWLDIRGNHDNYDVPSMLSVNNYYQNYSIQGPHYSHSYMYSLRQGTDSVAFIAVDAAQIPGPKFPYNFMGILRDNEMELLEYYEEQSRSHNYTIWFGHYPTSCVLSSKPGLRVLMERSYAYLCGHFHTAYGHVPQLYALQQSGSLELELADWKEKRMYRVAALDNGLFSFVDVKHGMWPVILITNPKDARFLMPAKEPVSLIRKSSHIRVLIWSTAQIKKVQCRINSYTEWLTMVHIDGPLYTVLWNPTMMSNGFHTIEVVAKDVQGNENAVSQSFSVDGEQIPFHIVPRFLLMANLTRVFQFMFGCMVLVCAVPICVVKIIHKCITERRLKRPRFRFHLVGWLARKIWVLTSVNKLFYPFLLAALYVPIGPWFIGVISGDHIGVAFAWGIFVNNAYIPGSITYFYGFSHMMTFHLPLLVLSAIAADFRYQIWYMQENRKWIYSLLNHCLFALVIINQAKKSYKFYLEYGAMTFLLGPLRTWSIFFGLYIWYASNTLKRHHVRSMALTWESCSTEEQALRG